MDGKNKSARKPKIDRAIQDKIGRELREMYAELLRQPLPENLIAPLRAMDAVAEARKRLAEAAQEMRRAGTSLTTCPEASTAEPAVNAKRA